MRVRLLVFLLLPLLTLAAGQQVEFGVRHDFAAGGLPGVQVTFSDMPVEGGVAGLRLLAGEELELGVRMRRSSSFATIGAVVASLAADGSTGGRYGAALTVRGTVGPAAVSARASVSDGEGELAPLREGNLSPLPVLGSGPPLVGLEAAATYRLSRNLLLDVAPGLFLRQGQLAFRTEAELRAIRVHGGNDAALLLHAFTPPGSSDFSFALGGRYSINERRAPAWHLSALVGKASGGPVLPGVRIAGASRLPSGALELDASAEPYRLDVQPYRATLRLVQELSEGELVVSTEVGAASGRPLTGSASLAYRLPVDR